MKEENCQIRFLILLWCWTNKPMHQTRQAGAPHPCNDQICFEHKSVKYYLFIYQQTLATDYQTMCMFYHFQSSKESGIWLFSNLSVSAMYNYNTTLLKSRIRGSFYCCTPPQKKPECSDNKVCVFDRVHIEDKI